LVSHSLIQVEVTLNGSIRLRLLEMFREFALSKLEARGEIDNARRRHAQYFAALLRRLDETPPGPGEMDRVDVANIESANMRAALSWCLAHDLPIGFILARYLNYHWTVNGNYHEGRAWTRQMLEADQRVHTVPPEDRAYLVCVGTMLYNGTPLATVEEQLELFRRLEIKEGMAMAEGVMGWMQMRSSPARSEYHLGTAISVLEADGQPKKWLSATLRMFRAVALYTRGDYTTSERLLYEAIQIHTQMQDGRGLTHAQNHLAWLYYIQGNYDRAIDLTMRALLLNQQFKDAYSVGRISATKALVEIELGLLTEAKASLADGMRVVEESSFVILQSLLSHVAGALAYQDGNIIDAHQTYFKSISISRQTGQLDYILLSLVNLAEIANERIEANLIVRWLCAVRANSQRLENYLPLSYQTRLDAMLGSASSQLNLETRAAEQRMGQTMTLDETIVLAQTMTETMLDKIAD